MFFVNRQKKIESGFDDYCQSVSKCMCEFQGALNQCIEADDGAAGREAFLKVHNSESIADDIRREIEVLMYSKSLFPESRGDVLGLLETMDKVPNQAESVIRMIWNQHIAIPSDHSTDIMRLSDVCCKCVDSMLEAAGLLFKDYKNVSSAIASIDELESEADRIEGEIIEKIFSVEHDSIDKILLRDLVEKISGISDRAENVGDRIRIIAAKRSI